MKKVKIAKIKTTIGRIAKSIVSITTVVTSIAVVFISVIGNQIAQTELERAEFARPIMYELAFVDAGTAYEVHYAGMSRRIPAKEPVINVTMGALKSVTVFHYDGHTLHYKGDLHLPHIVRPTIEAHMPPNPGYLIDDGVIYDYMFLLLVPVEGTPILHMLCVEVDIYSGTLLGTERFDKYHLTELRLNMPMGEKRREMLEIYEKFMDQLVALEAKSL